MFQRREGESVTEFTWRRCVHEIISTELEDLAQAFEGAGPDAPWRGQEIADHIRERIKNHPTLDAEERNDG